ncbi:PREDICTED: B-lymphocyte antigen CD20 [Elephantulus edwardii]|uniref:B-lymphocyte antigen CD20 n=1 Tax=Elephantulus edwardii TaxID=28737 RepID=UPI0003F0BBC5|nr:PREDICTED: B-lymphocyte antigen CD20 [Elephantulus edwardii]
MTTPRNSVSGTFPAEPMQRPLGMYPTQKTIPWKISSLTGPTQHFFIRESKTFGAIQIMNGLIHFALGGLLMIPVGIYSPICMAVWYPLWGGTLFIISGSLLVAAEKTARDTLIKGKMIMNSLGLFAAIAGIILLIMDIFNITLSHFFKMDSLYFIKAAAPNINIYNCEQAQTIERNPVSTQYCYSVRSMFLGIFAVMLIFSFFQKLVAAGTAENDWRQLCSKPRANVVLLSAEGKKEQKIEIKEQVVELTVVSSQPKNEEDVEIIPVLEEEEAAAAAEGAEINFPEPPPEQESTPVENDVAPNCSS